MHILMVSAENGALPGGKVGGIGDVIRDVPKALVAAGHEVSIITPGYQRLSKLPGAKLLNTLSINFCSSLETLSLFQVDAEATPGLNHYLIEHPIFSACGEGMIYCDDDQGPFATDAHKFALFCHAVCYALVTEMFSKPDLIHLHDWHSSLVLFLRKYLPVYKPLQSLPTVYTIHNLSIQGVRPFEIEKSSLESWFPIPQYSKKEIQDPITKSCVNMMRMGINLSDKVHVVSPTYAKEILNPSKAEQGFIGGENLEKDLQIINKKKKLVGILNGCEYSVKEKPKLSKSEFINLANKSLLKWVGNKTSISSAYFFAQHRLNLWATNEANQKMPIIASIGRLTAQKVSLLAVEIEPGLTTLEALLNELGNGLYIMIGSGDPYYENFMSAMMSKKKNFIFLQGYSDDLAEALYQFCDIFLMPSSYEPCGISQMLAMRAGKPCLVHQVGGLADTVNDGVNGVSFSGKTDIEKTNQLLERFNELLKLKRANSKKWKMLCEEAKSSRFSWNQSIKQYQSKLYSITK